MCKVCKDDIGKHSLIAKHTNNKVWTHIDCIQMPYATCHTCTNVGIAKVYRKQGMECRDCMSKRRKLNYPVA